MRKLVKRSLAFCLLLSMLFSMAKPALAAGGIKQKQLSLYTGQSAQLTLTGVKGKATWTTSNKKVATVSAAGNVKGVAKGNATITAKVGKASYQCKVTVKDPSISAASKTLTKGGKFTLSLNGTKIKAVATSNNKVATVAKPASCRQSEPDRQRLPSPERTTKSMSAPSRWWASARAA